MISEEVVVELATVEVNDDYRVSLQQLRKELDYSPEQARALAVELHAAAERADWLFQRDHENAGARMHDPQPRGVNAKVVF